MMNNPRVFTIKENRRLVLFLFCLVPFWLAACATQSTKKNSGNKLEAQKYYDLAEKAYSVKQKDEFYRNLDKAIELDPEEPYFHLVKGDAYFEDVKLDAAEQEYLTAIKLGIENPDGNRQLGRLYMQKRDWDSAIYYLKKATEARNLIAPHQIYNWLALCYYAKGELSNAEKTWVKSLGIKENGQIRMNLGLIYKEAAEFEKAKESLTKAIELDSKLVRAHYEIAQLYLKDRRFAEAREHFQKVIDLEPLGKSAKTSKEYLKLMPSE